MQNGTNGSSIIDEVLAASNPEQNHTIMKLATIRRFSNIAQSLENVIVQCGEEPEHEELKRFVHHYLASTQQELRRRIHSQ